MTAVLCLAAAVLVAPGREASARLVALRPWPGAVPRPRPARGGRIGVVAAVACPAAVLLCLCGPLQAAAVALLGATTVHLRAGARRRRREIETLGDWERRLDDAVAAVRSGSRPLAGGDDRWSRVGSGGGEVESGPHDALRTAAAVARLGGSAAESLRAHPDPIAAQLGAVWAVAERHGVPLAGVLDGLRGDVSRRRERSGRVEAALAGPRATAVILTALPALGVLMGSGIGADPLGTLGGGLLGGLLSIVGAGLLASGLLWTDRIVAGARA